MQFCSEPCGDRRFTVCRQGLAVTFCSRLFGQAINPIATFLDNKSPPIEWCRSQKRENHKLPNALSEERKLVDLSILHFPLFYHCKATEIFILLLICTNKKNVWNRSTTLSCLSRRLLGKVLLRPTRQVS